MRLNRIAIFGLFISALFCLGFVTQQTNKKLSLSGTWQLTNGTETWLLMAASNYCMISRYDVSNKKFIKTFGGFQYVENGRLHLDVRFHSNSADKYSNTSFLWKQGKDGAETDITGIIGKWKKMGEANNEMAGVWRITKRKQGDAINTIPLAPRRTLKFLTNDRFQWAAINIATGEFSGTGGGTYTFKNGVYTENIEFFSRDSSRVGMSLQFKDSRSGPDWIHTGASSKGEPIYEVWSKASPQEM